ARADDVLVHRFEQGQVFLDGDRKLVALELEKEIDQHGSCPMFRLAFILALLAAFAGDAAAQGFPNKPLRLIVSAGPGSVVDLRARQLASKLPDLLGQPLVIDNRPGGNGFLAAEAVARAPADGHTLLMGAQSIFAVNPWLF